MSVVDPDFDEPDEYGALPPPYDPDVNMGALERGASVTLGVALVALALSRRRGLADIGSAALGAYLLVRGTTGRCAVYDLLDTGTAGDEADERLGAGSHRDASVQAIATIARPPGEVYAFWRALENAPRFMDRIHSVTVLDDRRSHWSARLPGGRLVEWDAEIVEDRPGELLVWRSRPGAPVHHHGAVQFRPAPGDRGTEVHLEVELELPGGGVGRAVGRLLGRAAAYVAEDDLYRLRQLLEAGEVATTESQPRGGGDGHPALP
jgi:uncharacterized membrane protein